jgi:hypothetical protein
MLSRCGWILIVVSVSLLSAFAQNGLRPEIRVRPISLEMAPQVPMSLFPTPWGGTSPYQSDFFPASPTTLFDNTSPTGYYFPVSNIVFDDADIPESRDTDGDDIYFLTQWNIAFYVPDTAQQPVIASFYLAPPTATGGVDFGAMLAIENVSLGELTPGSYIVTITFPRCTPYQMQTLQITGSDGNLYDLFWVGLKFPQYCAPLYSGGGPGWLLADGPDYQGDIFYWDGDSNCGGNYGAGYYYFGGTPRGSFYIKVMGAATESDAIVITADIDGNGCVDDADLLAVLFAFGNTGSGLPEDTNCDEVIDDADLLNVLFAFGEGC